MRAFTLLEILTVIAIIFILFTLTLWSVTGMRRTTKNKVAAAELFALHSAIERYHQTYGAWPDRRLPDSNGNGVLKNKEIIRLLRNWKIDTLLNDPSGKDTHFNRDPMLEKLDAAQLDTDGNWRDPWGNAYGVSILPDDVWSIYQKKHATPTLELSATERTILDPYGSSQEQILYWIKTVRSQINLYSFGADKLSQHGSRESDDVRP